MRLDELRAPRGARRARKRVGRGNASKGTYSGRGMKGQKSRSGGGVRPSFEGGQLPLMKRLPTQRGFTNIFRVEYATVNVDELVARFDGNAEVTPQAMRDARLVRGRGTPVKVLGRGEIDRALTVSAHRFSSEARRKIEAAGGAAVEIAT
ncbi:MAG: 50S ribosomal protein L15 [Chloroflexota bacterium]|nr:50S ribosomal protein L15 [Chloroflexota bacterium]MDE2942408.1 50S ribosomal protein L15 [Chloroflexota bacterium]MDE3267912.1 50S ribosomal protein L15 [Chloroflexota bacterium]